MLTDSGRRMFELAGRAVLAAELFYGDGPWAVPLVIGHTAGGGHESGAEMTDRASGLLRKKIPVTRLLDIAEPQCWTATRRDHGLYVVAIGVAGCHAGPFLMTFPIGLTVLAGDTVQLAGRLNVS